MYLRIHTDMFSYDSYGKWEIKNDTLLLIFDTIKYPKNIFKENLYFRIKGRRLFYIENSENRYNDLVKNSKMNGYDTIKVPSFHKFNRHLNKNTPNYKGKIRKQYFKFFEEIDKSIKI